MASPHSIHSTLIKGSASFLGIILIFLVVLEFSQVILRYLWGYGLYWANDVTLLLLQSLGWLGAAHLWVTNQHLSLSLLDTRFPSYRIFISLLADALAVLGAIYLFPKILKTLSVYVNLDLSVLPVTAAVSYIPVLISVVLIGLSASIRLSLFLIKSVGVRRL